MLLSVEIKKTIMCVKKIIFRIPLYVVTKNNKYIGSIIDYSVVTWDENIEKNKNCSHEKYFNKNLSKNMYFNRFLHFTSLSFNYHSIIDSFGYLLLLDKILNKAKTFTTLPLNH